MEIGQPVCDPCRGKEFASFRPRVRPGSGLLRCLRCGALFAVDAAPALHEFDSPPRDLRVDRLRARAVMRLIDGGRVLELGCGPGHFLASLDPARYEAVGLEADPEKAREANRLMREAGLRGGAMSIVEGARALPAESFEAVTFFGTLGRTTSPRAALMETSRLLAPGGLAVIETPCLSSLTARVLGGRWEPLADRATAWFFSANSLDRLAAACGLRPVAHRGSFLSAWPKPGDLLFLSRKAGVTVRSRDLAGVTPASAGAI